MAEEDVCEEYRSSLMDLTCNSKPLINMLTMLAEDNIKSAPKIVQAIETHLAKVNPDSKLPVLYLIDSIIKNVGGVYQDLFTQNIVSVFCSVFEKVDEKTRMQMFKLRQTWNEIFPAKKMYAIDLRVKGIDPAWPILAPKPSQKNIHFNPKFLDGKPSTTATPVMTTVAEVPKTPASIAVAVPEEHTEVRQKLLAKQQELLKLQQQRVEIELLQAKLKLEEQMKESSIKKPVNNIVPGSSQVDSMVSVSSITCTSFTSAINQDVQIQQHNTQQFQLLNTNALTTAIHTDPRLNRVSVLPGRDPRIKKMIPGMIHPATILTRPVLPSILPASMPIRAPPVQGSLTTSSRIVVPPTLNVPVTQPPVVAPQISPKKSLMENKENPPKETIVEIKNIKVEKEDNPTTAKSKVSADTSSPMIIDLTSEDDAPKKTSPPKKVIRGKRNEKNYVKKITDSPERKKKRATSPRSKRSSSREDNDRQKSRKDHRSSRSKTRSRSRSPSRTPPRRSKKNEKKTGKSSPNKNSSPKKSSKSKKAQTKSVDKSLDLDKTGDVDLRQLPVIAATGDVDHRILNQEVQILEEKGPPVKKLKLEDEVDSLFGKGDQDYRLPSLSADESRSRENDNEDRRRSRERQRNWAQYKADHPDEIKSPLKHRENSTESLNDRDFRIPKYSNYNDDSRRRGVDRLGRPLLSSRPKLDSRHEFFRNQQPDDLQIAFMLEKQDDILREANEQMRSGVITTEDYGRVLAKFKNLSEQYQLNRLHSNSDKDVIELPPSKPILIDGQKREIKFFGRKAIVIMDDNKPHEVTFTGAAKGVSVDGKEFFKLGFAGASKEFIIEGKTQTIQFGAPSREVYINGIPYAAVFGGDAITVQIDGKPHQLRIGGPSPNVEISDDPISMAVLEEEVNKEAERQKAEAKRRKAQEQPANNLDRDLRQGIGEIKPQELGDIDMRVAPVPVQVDRVRSSPKDAGSPKPSGSPSRAERPERPERVSRWEAVDRSAVNRTVKQWDSPRRDNAGNSWNSPDRQEWKNTMEPVGDRRNLMDAVSNVRTNFGNFQSSDKLGKNDSSVPVWNNQNQIPPIGSGTASWDWRLNQSNNFQPQSQMRPNIQGTNMTPFQPMSNMMPNMMPPSMNQMQANYRIPRLMGNNNLDGSQNFNFGMRPQQPGFIMPNQNFFRGPNNVGAFNQMPNQGLVMPNQNFDSSHFVADGRNQAMQGVDNYPQGGNTGDKRVPLLPHPPATSSMLMPQNPTTLHPPPTVDIPAPLDVSSLLAKLISTGLIKTDTNTTASTSSADPVVGNAADVVVGNSNEILPKEERHIEAIPPIELASESLKMRYPGVIDLLYRGTQCASCGMRFKESQQDKYSQHLDWHFRANRREKDGAKKAFSRKWFYDVEDWYQFEETEDLDDRARSFFELQAGEEQFQAESTPEEIPSVTASQDQSENNCVVCSEPFQMFWVEDEEEWHLKGAIRREGKTYHPLCYEDFIKAQAAEVAETPVEETPINPLETSLETETEKKEGCEEDEKVGEKEDQNDEETPETGEDKTEVDLEAPMEEEGPMEDKTEVKEEAEDAKLEGDESTAEKLKEEPEEKSEETPAETKDDTPPFDEEIIGVISESEMPSDEEDDKNESKPEAKMVTLQPGGRPGKIVMKVKADSIINPLITTRPETPTTSTGTTESNNEGEDAKPSDKTNESEIEEFRPPSPDPRFENFAPVQRGKELSGLCSIM